MSRLLLALVALVGLAGCTGRADRAGEVEPDAGRGAVDLGHVHGLGTDPADGTVYVATHFGVFRLGDGEPERVADRWQDTMAFTVSGPGRFLASGHPDLREDLPPHLGLIESTDAAATWQEVSLQGEADFHALEAGSGRIYGYDAVSGALLTSPDGRDWTTVAEAASVIDLAMDPADPDRVLATTGDLAVVEYAATARDGAAGGAGGDGGDGGDGGELRPLPEAPSLAFLDWPEPDLLVGLSADSTLFRSADGGRSWAEAGGLDGDPRALDVQPGRWHAATSTGVYESTDDGTSWTLLVEE